MRIIPDSQFKVQIANCYLQLMSEGRGSLMGMTQSVGSDPELQVDSVRIELNYRTLNCCPLENCLFLKKSHISCHQRRSEEVPPKGQRGPQLSLDIHCRKEFQDASESKVPTEIYSVKKQQSSMHTLRGKSSAFESETCFGGLRLFFQGKLGEGCTWDGMWE